MNKLITVYGVKIFVDDYNISYPLFVGICLKNQRKMRFTMKRNYYTKRRNAMKFNLDFAAGAVAGICLMRLVQIIRRKGNRLYFVSR